MKDLMQKLKMIGMLLRGKRYVFFMIEKSRIKGEMNATSSDMGQMCKILQDAIIHEQRITKLKSEIGIS